MARLRPATPGGTPSKEVALLFDWVLPAACHQVLPEEVAERAPGWGGLGSIAGSENGLLTVGRRWAGEDGAVWLCRGVKKCE